MKSADAAKVWPPLQSQRGNLSVELLPLVHFQPVRTVLDHPFGKVVKRALDLAHAGRSFFRLGVEAAVNQFTEERRGAGIQLLDRLEHLLQSLRVEANATFQVAGWQAERDHAVHGGAQIIDIRL